MSLCAICHQSQPIAAGVNHLFHAIVANSSPLRMFGRCCRFETDLCDWKIGELVDTFQVGRFVDCWPIIRPPLSLAASLFIYSQFYFFNTVRLFVDGLRDKMWFKVNNWVVNNVTWCLPTENNYPPNRPNFIWDMYMSYTDVLYGIYSSTMRVFFSTNCPIYMPMNGIVIFCLKLIRCNWKINYTVRFEFNLKASR